MMGSSYTSPPLLSISLCMIVKNEARYLERCLLSAKEVAKQLIVVDTGSDDETVDIARSCGAEVYHHPWEGSFSKARNLSLQYAKEDWILILDGDEELDAGFSESLRGYDLSDPQLEALNFQILNFTTDRAIITEAGIIDQIRLFKNTPQHRYSGLVHNQLLNIAEDRPLVAQQTPLRVLHYGYTPSVWAAQNKDARIEMHERAVEQDPHNHFIRYNYGNHLKILKFYSEALEQFLLAIPPMSIFESMSAEEIQSSSEIIWGTSACFLGAFCANKIKRYDVSLSLIEEALCRRPHLIDAKLRGAEAHIGLKQYHEAETLLRSGLLDDQVQVTKLRALHFDAPYRLGRALFLSHRRSLATPAFASVIPQCQDITVFTHLCLCAIELKIPYLWRYARSRGAELDAHDPDWKVVDQAIMHAEEWLNYQALNLEVVIESDVLTHLDLNVWALHLQTGLKELFDQCSDPLPSVIDFTFIPPTDVGYLCLSVHSDYARLSVQAPPQGTKGSTPVYRCPERFKPIDVATPIESAALLLASMHILT